MGILDWRILDIVDTFYDRGLNQPTPDPNAWKKWYPNPEAIGLVDPTQFPAKPKMPTSPLFPNIELEYGSNLTPINDNPTIRDCIKAGRWSDLIFYGGAAAACPLHFTIYQKYTPIGLMVGVVSGFLLGSTFFLASSSSRLLGLRHPDAL